MPALGRRLGYRNSATRLTFFRAALPYIRSANENVKGLNMAQLHGNGWSNGRRDNNKNRMTPIGSWSRTKPEETEPRNPIELRGSTYLAFCKVWAPLWIDEDEAID
jgi:hypothetical protein